MRCITCLPPPTIPVHHPPQSCRRHGYRNPGFLPYISGYENLKRLAQLNRKIGDTEIRDAIARVGLDPFSKKKVGQYSLGMRERLGIAQAIMERPKLLILDEPFNGLDKRGAQDVCELFVELKEKGTTILLAAHNVMEMEWLCDTVCEMDAGQLEVVYENEIIIFQLKKRANPRILNEYSSVRSLRTLRYRYSDKMIHFYVLNISLKFMLKFVRMICELTF